MYLALIVLPILGSIISGFFGRKVGVSGSQIITCSCVIITTILAIFAFIEVGLNNIPVTINLFRWVDSESLNIAWAFNFDALTVSMLIPVLIVSSVVHIYSIGYMSHDPHNQRFFSYLSLFTFMMIVLVTANNFLLMFVGWEGVGICSYLLVSFWFTRIAANQSSMAAFLANRVGDCFLTIGMFVILWSFGNVDYYTVFSLAPYYNENVVIIIGICLLIGAMAKSSQVGLHVWLPMAMEGLRKIYLTLIKPRFIYISNSKLNIGIKNFSYIRKTRLIWVYDIRDLSLVYGAPFSSKIKCALVLKINPRTVAAYLDKDKIFDYKWVFSSLTLSEQELSKWQIPKKIWDIITGELLGDGHIKYDSVKSPQINGRLEFTFSSKILHYANYLKYDALAFICTESEVIPWPNYIKTGKEPTQYWFSTKRMLSITQLYDIWYKKVDGKYLKRLPLNIKELLTPLGLAHWIMGDGYYSEDTVKICTDNFSKEEVLNLISVLEEKFGIKATLKRRRNPNENIVWRIRVSKSSMENLKLLVVPYMIPEMLYKVGLKK